MLWFCSLNSSANHELLDVYTKTLISVAIERDKEKMNSRMKNKSLSIVAAYVCATHIVFKLMRMAKMGCTVYTLTRWNAKMGIFPQNRFKSNDKYTTHGKLSTHVE